jgi:hypothetical protein
MPVRVFLSYAHADESLRHKFETHLAMLKREGEIEVWHDRELVVGDHLDDEISDYLETADLIVLLVSADFLASYYCYEREMARALERADAGASRLAPIILRACDWKSTPFAKYVLAPTDARPIVEHPDIDAAFLQVVNELRRAISKVTEGRADNSAGAGEETEVFIEDTVSVPRSSNLRIRKEFSEADAARFLDDAFEFIFRFFENTVSELQKRNPGIEGIVRRSNAERFTVELFQGGSRASSATVFVSRSFGSEPMIAYSNALTDQSNSMNGGFRVEHDDQIQFLKPWMFMFGRGGDEKAKLSYHGAAELLWEQVVAPLQR